MRSLLACLLSLHRLFAQDYSDGTLEQLLLSSEPAALWVMGLSVRLFGLSSWSILVPQALMGSCDQGGVYFDPMETTYFASRETVVARRQGGMPIWRDKLFAAMHRNAAPATGFFRIPGNRLVELGAQVEI